MEGIQHALQPSHRNQHSRPDDSSNRSSRNENADSRRTRVIPALLPSFQRKLEPRRARQRSAHGARERKAYAEHGVGWDGDLARCAHTQAVRAMNRKIIITTNLAAIVFSMASVLAFTWFSSYAGGLYVQILTTLLTASLLIALFFEKPRQVFELDNIKTVSLWISIPLTLLVVILIDMYLNRLVSLIPPEIALNIGFLCILVFSACIYYWIAGRQPFLVTAAALNIGGAWLWLDLEILKSAAGEEFLLGSLLVAMFLGIPWIIALRSSWECAKRTQHRHRRGLSWRASRCSWWPCRLSHSPY